MLKALVTDVDGTITDRRRRINTEAIEAIRVLVDTGIEVVLASGNTVCFMDGLCRMVGTDGTIIGENGGVYRRGFPGTLHIPGDQEAALEALRSSGPFCKEGVTRSSECAACGLLMWPFARKIDPDAARAVIRDHRLGPVAGHPVCDPPPGPGVNKGGDTISAGEMGLRLDEILAIGDSENDIEMLRAAGVGVAVAMPPGADSVSGGLGGRKRMGMGL